jgi:hypothetical protein
MGLFFKKHFFRCFLITAIMCISTMFFLGVWRTISKLLWKHLIYALSIVCRVPC